MFLGGDAKDVQSKQFSLVEYDFEGASLERYNHGTSPHVTNALIRGFLTEAVLREAHDKVARAEQSDQNAGDMFAERNQRPARLCGKVFGNDERIKSYT